MTSRSASPRVCILFLLSIDVEASWSRILSWRVFWLSTLPVRAVEERESKLPLSTASPRILVLVVRVPYPGTLYSTS
jgi:hypothetical protein